MVSVDSTFDSWLLVHLIVVGVACPFFFFLRAIVFIVVSQAVENANKAFLKL